MNLKHCGEQKKPEARVCTVRFHLFDSLKKVNQIYYDVTQVAGCMRLEVGEGFVWDVNTRELFKVMKILYILILVMFTQVYKYVETL